MNVVSGLTVASDFRFLLSAGNGRYQCYLISFFELVVFAQEADVLVIDINIQEATNVALFIAQVRLEVREAAAERIQQSSQVSTFTITVISAGSVPPKRARNGNFNAHFRQLLCQRRARRRIGFQEIARKQRVLEESAQRNQICLQERTWS